MNRPSPLCEYITGFYNSVSIPTEPIAIASVELLESSFTQKALDYSLQKYAEVLNLWVEKHHKSPPVLTHIIGLNTIGMLADRLSILCIKKAVQSNSKPIDQNLDCQIREIDTAIQSVSPGHSSSFNKVTTSSLEYSSTAFDEVLLDLCIANLLLWLAQDVLYLRGPATLPSSELRDYILLFSRLNIRRNLSISRLEALLWNNAR